MANRHSMRWRKPGRREEERKRFAALMRRVEQIRIREGLSKTELADKLDANVDGIRAWMSGRTVGRKESVDKIKAFLTRRKTARASDIARS